MSSRAPRDLLAGSASTMPADDAIFIPLCGLHNAMVIPALSRIPASRNCPPSSPRRSHTDRGGYGKPGTLSAPYMAASRRIGITSDLAQRVWQHQNDLAKGFTSRYGVHHLVWHETHPTMESVIEREKHYPRHSGPRAGIHPLNHAISPPSAVLSNFGKAPPPSALIWRHRSELVLVAPAS